MKRIPDNIECLDYDGILEEGTDANDVNWFSCQKCHVQFGTHPSVRFPKFCPNCGETYTWLDPVAYANSVGHPC
jgi:hypothetical protein